MDGAYWGTDYGLQLGIGVATPDSTRTESTTSFSTDSGTTGTRNGGNYLLSLKVSTQFRSSQLLKSILGLTDKNSFPTPQKTIELLKTRPGYQEARQGGVIGLILDPLVDQRLFEPLMTKSRDSYASGVRHWIMFTEVLRMPPRETT